MKNLIRGDLAPTPVDLLSKLVDGFFLPAIGNTSNTVAWPHVVQHDVAEAAQDLQLHAKVVAGQMSGKTRLPLPSSINYLFEADAAKHVADSEEHLLLQLESMVIQWSHQVSGVLKIDSAQPLIDGLHVGPFTEVEFWENRLLNLESIHVQLFDTRASVVWETLVEQQSVYAELLAKVREDVEEAIRECEDITLYGARFKAKTCTRGCHWVPTSACLKQACV
jgi:dynein heavy chain